MADPKFVFFHHPTCAAHHPGPGHPEHPGRVADVIPQIQTLFPENPWRESRLATVDEIARTHDNIHLERVARTEGVAHTALDPDTHTSEQSYRAARYAVGAALDVVDHCLSNAGGSAFAVVRPPGHHATPSQAMGFCLFNNIAVATDYALARPDIDRVAIIDIDVHHGNGTQDAFYDRGEVLFVSLHRYPFYPGTGSLDEVGSGDGRGWTINIPLPGGCGDSEYLWLFEQTVEPAVAAHQPDLILVSAGFDTWWRDPLGGFSLTGTAYAHLAQVIYGLAARYCGGRVGWIMEGGYAQEGLIEGIGAIARGHPTTSGKRPFEAEMPPNSWVDDLLRTAKLRHHMLR